MAKDAGKISFDSDAFLANEGRGRTLCRFRAKEVIYSQGDFADAVYFIHQGNVKIIVTSRNGKEAVLALLGEDHFFGERCLLARTERPATACSMSETVIMRIEKDQMIRVLKAEPEFAEYFMAHLLNRIGRVEEDLVDHLFNSSEKRLARVLLLLGTTGEEGRSEPIAIKVSQETLAEMVGTTRSRISFFMNRFRKLGYIEYRGKLKVYRSLMSVISRD